MSRVTLSPMLARQSPISRMLVALTRRPGAALFAALVLASAWIAPAAAEPQDFRIDKVHAQVLFFVSHLGFSYPMGRFPGVEGTFVFDPEDWSASHVEASIDVASLYLGDEKWQKKMLSDEFFDAKRYPQMRFVSEKVESTGKDTGKVHGQLTLHGATRPVVLELRLNRIGRHSFSFGYAAGFSATAKLKRSDFGMKRLLPAVGDEIDIRLEIEGLRDKAGD